MDVLFKETLFRIVTWTLIHSLWQGIIIAVLAGVVMAITIKRTPVLRYNLLTALFCLFITGVGITFVAQLTFSDDITEGLVNIHSSSVINWLYRFIEIAAVYIVMIWLLVIVYKAFQIRSDLRQVKILRKKGCTTTTMAAHMMFLELCEKMGIDKQVKIMESFLVKVPVVIGHMKPVVLVPAGLLTSLPSDELEAILLHELAHIRRNDYLVNLLQRFAEMIFFFNPALLWLSAQMRIEREHCCDEQAIAVSGNKEPFVRALISCKEFVNAHQSYAPGFFSKKHLLLSRVSRIVYNKNETLSREVQLGLTAGVVILLGLMFSKPVNLEQRQRPLVMKQEKKEVASHPTLPVHASKSKTLTQHKDERKKGTKRNLARKQPEAQPHVDQNSSALAGKYRNNATNSVGAFESTRETEVVASTTVEREHITSVVGHREHTEYERRLTKMKLLEAQQHRLQTEQDHLQAVLQRQHAKQAKLQAKETNQQAEHAKLQADQANLEAEYAKQQTEHAKLQAQRQRRKAEFGQQITLQ